MPDTPPPSPRVVVEVDAGVADVRLNRPEKINAFDRPMFDGLAAAAEAVGADPSVRAVVLSGEGRGFSAGLDLAIFSEMSGATAAGTSLGDRSAGGPANRAQQAVWAWHELDVPVIAAVHGAAVGAGFQLSLGADIRIVAPDVRMSVLEIRWGLIPDMTGTWLLPRLVGPQVAKELTWTGRMVDGAEAVAIGLALRCADDPRAEALALARRIAGSSPDAVRAGKRLIESSLGRDDVAEHLLDEERTMGSLIGSPNQVEAIAAYFDRRDAAYADR